MKSNSKPAPELIAITPVCDGLSEISIRMDQDSWSAWLLQNLNITTEDNQHDQGIGYVVIHNHHIDEIKAQF
ncbi:hypothetical protein NFHSH190041_37010 (plasmid) [Shewanella sp. NFH-SH190041]|uniref:hypothetical protein n=1 Tax=Shewanella sp. NFH-SH190041 TaxID=2950245 RepID=UPI0021C2C07D|nr:hypothetical protein [Shewanella sp. NFH-SH190041]BDM66249.1 hypothetical protein NFHSH190041_37010 [Shewanella sp. NFH-SH190041]